MDFDHISIATRRSRAPLQVYLDSSDFSDLSDARKLAKEPFLSEIKKELLQLRDAGLCEYRFSIIHVAEAAPLNQAADEWAKSRAKAIGELCGSKCLLIRDKIERIEVLLSAHPDCLAAKNYSLPSYAYDDTGDWFPDLNDFGQSVYSEILEQARSQIKQTSATRKDKRAKERAWFTADGRLTTKYVDLLTSGEGGERIFRELERKYPLPTNFRLIYKQFLLGKKSVNDFVAALKPRFLDVENYMRWFCERTHNNEDFALSLRVDGAFRAEKIMAMQSEIDIALSSATDINRAQLTLKQRIKTSVRQRKTQLAKRFAAEHFTENEIWFKERGLTREKFHRWLDDGNMPAIVETYVDLQAANYEMSVWNRRSAEKMTSDTGDIFHGLYVPYVDIFRTDGFASQVIGPIAEKHGTRVVSKLRELPDAIRRRTN